MKKRFAKKPTGLASAKASGQDDMRSEYDFSHSRPNPYAARAKVYRGGARPGAGRKPVAQPMERHTITVHPTDAQFLRSLDPNFSKAIRKLIAKAR